MPIHLSAEEKATIQLTIRRAFSDFKYFDRVETPLQQLLTDATSNYDLNYEKTKNILDYIPDRADYKTKDQQEILTKFRVILTAAAVLIYDHHPEAATVKYRDIPELLQHYPEYSSLQHSTVLDDQRELEYLLKFRNFMAVALLIVAAKSNKLFLLKVIERLEGSNNEYITGSGQKPSTTRRLEIYKKEGIDNNPLVRRPAPKSSSSSSKPPLPPAPSSSSKETPAASTQAPSSSSQTTFSAQKKRKLDSLQDPSLPTTSTHQPSNNVQLSQLSQFSTSSGFSLPSSQEDVTNLFVRSETFRVISRNGKNSTEPEINQVAALPSTPPLSRTNSLLRYTSEAPDLIVDDEMERKLLEDQYKGSFTATIEEKLGKRK